MSDDFIVNTAVQNNMADLPTIRAFERIGDALQFISDEGRMDRGLGMGSCDLWIWIAGREYLVEIKPIGGLGSAS